METFQPEGSAVLRGRPLRYLLVGLLREAGRPMTLVELVTQCEREGVVFLGRASKVISDAVRWECDRGRVRVRRGVYASGQAPRSTLYWISKRVEAIRAAPFCPTY